VIITNETLKPIKKSGKALCTLISKSIATRNYVILPHANLRKIDRSITDIDILDILENKNNRKRKRNKVKDSYVDGFFDWKYCIEGNDLDKSTKIRLIISFNEDSDLLIITVIR
jgi:hypothetical protein